MNPITTEALREDWTDDPNLSEDEAALLQNLSDTTLEDALDAAFTPYEDRWFSMLDEVRGAATRALLAAAAKVA